MAPMLDYVERKARRDSPRPSANFAVQPASVVDVRRLVDIEFNAFENEHVNHVLSYRDYDNPVHFERSVKGYTQALLEADRPSVTIRPGGLERAAGSSRTTFLKVMNRESDELVSFAKIDITRYTPVEWHSPADSGHEGEAQMNRDWFALNERSRREYMGLREHCYIGMLATQPQHQHHGAGTMLLNAILAEADRRGIECYLEGTSTAKPLYEKHGFRPLKELRFDPAEYGIHGLGVERQTIMVRGAIGFDGARLEPESWEVATARVRAEMENCPAAIVAGRL